MRGEEWQTTCSYANACGALAVSRHGCAPSYASESELLDFIKNGSEYQALRFDTRLNHLHRATNRRKNYHRLIAFAFDHRQQFDSWAQEYGRDSAAIGQFKELAWTAALEEAGSDPGFGVLVDDRLGRSALQAATSSGAWVGRPIEASGQFPLAFEAEGEITEHLADWPLTQTVKLLCPYRLDDDAGIRARHEQMVQSLDRACQHTGHEWLLEIITSRNGSDPAFESVAIVMQHFYKLGVKPDWWKLEPGTDAAYWNAIGQVIDEYDPWCQGVIVLGLDGSIESISESFKVASCQSWVKGFAVGRTLFAQTARDWLSRTMDDTTAITTMRANYRGMIDAWDNTVPGINKE